MSSDAMVDLDTLLSDLERTIELKVDVIEEEEEDYSQSPSAPASASSSCNAFVHHRV